MGKQLEVNDRVRTVKADFGAPVRWETGCTGTVRDFYDERRQLVIAEFHTGTFDASDKCIPADEKSYPDGTWVASPDDLEIIH